MNRVMLVGTIPREPDVRLTSSGRMKCSFAVDVQFQTKVRQEIETIDCVAWEPLASALREQLSKGRTVLVDGRLHVRRVEGADGQKKRVTEVVAREVKFMDCPKHCSCT